MATKVAQRPPKPRSGRLVRGVVFGFATALVASAALPAGPGHADPLLSAADLCAVFSAPEPEPAPERAIGSRLPLAPPPPASPWPEPAVAPVEPQHDLDPGATLEELIGARGGPFWPDPEEVGITAALLGEWVGTLDDRKVRAAFMEGGEGWLFSGPIDGDPTNLYRQPVALRWQVEPGTLRIVQTNSGIEAAFAVRFLDSRTIELVEADRPPLRWERSSRYECAQALTDMWRVANLSSQPQSTWLAHHEARSRDFHAVAGNLAGLARLREEAKEHACEEKLEFVTVGLAEILLTHLTCGGIPEPLLRRACDVTMELVAIDEDPVADRWAQRARADRTLVEAMGDPNRAQSLARAAAYFSQVQGVYRDLDVAFLQARDVLETRQCVLYDRRQSPALPAHGAPEMASWFGSLPVLDYLGEEPPFVEHAQTYDLLGMSISSGP